MIPTISILEKQPKLTLVGAGPGDPELISLKGVNTLRRADVVLFDALVSTEILSYIPNGVPSYSVGKRAGEHSYSQEEINDLIVELAYSHGHVVRLKGGDPFVFGRGAEELEYAEKHGIETAVVPGISSAIAVPAAIQVPVTARGVSESFWVITATTKSGELSKDVALACQSSATIVILMGMNKVDEIMEVFKANGRADSPVAIVQNGTLPSQKNTVGTVSTISQLTQVEDLRSPGVIIIGEVVRYAKEVNKVLHSSALKNYE